MCEIDTLWVPLVTSGALGTIATSSAPLLFSLYSLATWSAIWLVTFAVVPEVGLQVDHPLVLACPGFMTSTTSPASAPASTIPSSV